MKRKLYAGNLFCFLCSYGATAQSYEYVVATKAGSSPHVTRIPNAGDFNVSWSNNGKEIACDVVGGPSIPLINRFLLPISKRIGF